MNKTNGNYKSLKWLSYGVWATAVIVIGVAGFGSLEATRLIQILIGFLVVCGFLIDALRKHLKEKNEQ
jgi:hypothetical protein